MNKQKRFILNLGVFTKITPQKENENDKERLMKKFSFTLKSRNNSKSKSHQMNNNDILSNKSLNQINRLQHMNFLTTKPSINNSLNLSLNTSIKGKENKLSRSANIKNCYNKKNEICPALNYTHSNSNAKIGKKSDSRNALISNNSNSHTQSKKINQPSTNVTTDTRKDIEYNIALIKKRKENFNENLSNISKTENENQNGSNNLSEAFLDIDTGKENNEVIIKRNINQSNEDNSNELSKQNEYENTQNYNESKEEEMQSYDKSEVSNNQMMKSELSQSQLKKLFDLFNPTPKYLISNRLLNDEITIHHHPFNASENPFDYRFISKIREHNNRLIQFNTISFLKLSNKSLYYLLSFIFELFDIIKSNTNKIIESRINWCLHSIFEPIIIDFKKIYGNIIQLHNYHFCLKTFRKKRAILHSLDLVIQAKVITNCIDKSYEFSCEFQSKNMDYNIKWKFDIKSKDDICYWLLSELEMFNEEKRRFCYSQPIGKFTYLDTIEFRIPVFTNNDTLDPLSLKWNNIIETDTPKGFYQKSLFKCPYPFDPYRACEVENMIHLWKSENNLINKILVKQFRAIFERLFGINQVVFDYSKFYFFKFIMTARYEGKIKKNKFTQFMIEIIGKNKEAINEIQSNCLLNSIAYTNRIQLRVGCKVVFYIIDTC